MLHVFVGMQRVGERGMLKSKNNRNDINRTLHAHASNLNRHQSITRSLLSFQVPTLLGVEHGTPDW